MKKYLLSIFAGLIFMASFGQSTIPKFGSGTGTNQDNTGRVMTYTKVAVTDAVGADSIVLTPRHNTVYVDVTLLDSFTLKQPIVTGCFYGDHLVIIAHAPSGTPFLKFTGSKWITAGKATLGAGLRAIIELYFDGVSWVESGRAVQ